MNKWVWVVIVLVVLAGGYFLLKGGYQSPYSYLQPATQPTTSTAPTGQANQVTIQNFSFSPAEMTVKKDTTVTWTNQDSAPHTITADSGTKIDSPQLNTGETYSVTFDSEGEFTYHCSIHPNMKGKVTVTP